MEWARGVTRVSVLTGAGISTDSGIPDFRGPDGVWTKNPRMADLFTYRNYMTDQAVREQFWAAYSGHTAWTAEPNAAHRALADLDRAGLAVRVLTQNIDGLHQRGGTPDRKVLELHGSMRNTVCVGCEVSQPSEKVLARVAAGEKDPACQDCGGILKLDVILFGQYLDSAVFAKAGAIAAASHLFIAIGSTLEVEPAASLCRVAVDAGARLVIVNRDPTPYDHLAAEVITEPIGTAVPRICQAVLDGRTA
ncbi:SIR2 family NAD-dependent protein deacylase [Kibdelosporangium phytohabitans]|uniref:protein acetyllysine N-acetyltransferase n=1 Tax=Kibdelosporangium phytohabitans TaxID=860235 RepID=A0A0N9IA10_9PSEU|nr:Sir2 family NAD-dependent protein deacetylase [Kibdelosporangium phytohabitans]ALG11305.1 NAD-dependent deacetylase [Kibdelosporangium phytohabitans]MBE1462603.1 NAD-dependent deacetylase [Kibdelosporangium phytohabitans]